MRLIFGILGLLIGLLMGCIYTWAQPFLHGALGVPTVISRTGGALSIKVPASGWPVQQANATRMHSALDFNIRFCESEGCGDVPVFSSESVTVQDKLEDIMREPTMYFRILIRCNLPAIVTTPSGELVSVRPTGNATYRLRLTNYVQYMGIKPSLQADITQLMRLQCYGGAAGKG